MVLGCAHLTGPASLFSPASVEDAAAVLCIERCSMLPWAVVWIGKDTSSRVSDDNRSRIGGAPLPRSLRGISRCSRSRLQAAKGVFDGTQSDERTRAVRWGREEEGDERRERETACVV